MLGTQKSKGLKKNSKTSHHFNIINKKIKKKTIKTNSPNKTALIAFSMGKNLSILRVSYEIASCANTN